MIKEIYCKLPSDLNYQNKIETTDELEQILQQIRMVLGTKHGQVLGSYHFGIDLQQYLFNYNQSQAQILYNVNTALAQWVKFDESKYTVYADVAFGKNNNDDTSDYAVIDIIVNQKKCIGILVNQE